MAEEGVPGGSPLISNRLLIGVIGAVLIVVLFFTLWSFRGCVPAIREQGYQTIYSHLDLRDSANVIARLKELKIPFEVKEDGTAIAVPKDKSDDARLGLAEKNLPLGGAVGWEIFNETRMGATDFDRRIQLIRAISGELSRTIRRIRGVEDTRVQIVLPETKLFEATTAPVTAAVLLKITPGFRLKPEQINGIVHLTASSVENLKPENVTVVDESGNILTAKYVPPPIPEIPPITQLVTAELTAPIEQKIIAKAPIQMVTREVVEKVTPRPLTAEERTMLKIKAKEEYERQLTARSQELLNQFYPPNSVIVRVLAEFGTPPSGALTRLKIKTDSIFITQAVKKLTAIVLVDKRVPLTRKLKTDTYQMVAAAIGYQKKRGDRIVIKSVPFRYASGGPITVSPITPRLTPAKLPQFNLLNWGLLASGAVAVVIILVLFFFTRRSQPAGTPTDERLELTRPTPPSPEEAQGAISDVRNLAAKDPGKLANLLKKWLTEDGA
ncbi:flagellar M-ring protein FliF [Candidatus Saganbacteria bacterium]|nr:flagellar M-ring protein FliF [Candidatus Saganbacteria bacterium]